MDRRTIRSKWLATCREVSAGQRTASSGAAGPGACRATADWSRPKGSGVGRRRATRSSGRRPAPALAFVRRAAAAARTEAEASVEARRISAGRVSLVRKDACLEAEPPANAGRGPQSPDRAPSEATRSEAVARLPAASSGGSTTARRARPVEPWSIPLYLEQRRRLAGSSADQCQSWPDRHRRLRPDRPRLGSGVGRRMRRCGRASRVGPPVGESVPEALFRRADFCLAGAVD